MLPRILKAKNDVKKMKKGGESRGVLGRGHSPWKSIEVQNLGMSWACTLARERGSCGMVGDGATQIVWSHMVEKLECSAPFKEHEMGLGCPLSYKCYTGRKSLPCTFLHPHFLARGRLSIDVCWMLD